MQKALWLTALAFVVAAVAAVTLAEFGHNHPDTTVGRAVMALQGRTAPAAEPVTGTPVRLMSSPMVDLGEVDDRAALRDLKVLAYLQTDTEPGKAPGRTSDYLEDFDQPVVTPKPVPVQRAEEECEHTFFPCPCMFQVMHRMSMARLMLCDCQQAIGQVCAAMAAQQVETASRGRIIYRNVVLQECCPPPCGFWNICDEDCPPDCCSKPCSVPQPCCQPVAFPCCPMMPPMPCNQPVFYPSVRVMPPPCCQPMIHPGCNVGPTMPVRPAPVICVERCPEPRSAASTVKLKIVAGGQTQEVRISGVQVEVEIRIDGKGEMKAETAAKQGCCCTKAAGSKPCCAEGCCGKCCKSECSEGCCGKCSKSACSEGCCGKCCKTEAEVKEVTGCKCGSSCTEKKDAKPATCPGCCCGEKKNCTRAELMETTMDPELVQAGFSGAASSARPMRMVTRIFPVGDLLDVMGTTDEQLVDGCTMKVSPASWQAYGGMGQIAYYPPGRCLVVRQTEDVCEELEVYLAKLRAKNLPPVPPDVPDEGTYLLPFPLPLPKMPESYLRRLELPPAGNTILELVPVSPVDPSVPGFKAPVATPERLPMCQMSSDIATSVIQAQAVQTENNAWLYQWLVPFYSLEQFSEKK